MNKSKYNKFKSVNISKIITFHLLEVSFRDFKDVWVLLSLLEGLAWTVIFEIILFCKLNCALTFHYDHLVL